MSAAQPVASRFQLEGEGVCVTTLLELVRAISEVTSDEREVVATVLHLLSSGRARLCGNFRGASVEDLR
jgi:hypothetical protein